MEGVSIGEVKNGPSTTSVFLGRPIEISPGLCMVNGFGNDGSGSGCLFIVWNGGVVGDDFGGDGGLVR